MVKSVFFAMIVTTKRGDGGLTSLYGAARLAKHHPLIKVIGSLDEIQVVIGLLVTKLKNRRLLAEQRAQQQCIYRLMADIANAKALNKKQYQDYLQELEQRQTAWLKKTAIKNRFVVPGQNELEIVCHIIRVRTRSVERLLSEYSSRYPKLKLLLPYFNRLSDYYFILSQYLA